MSLPIWNGIDCRYFTKGTRYRCEHFFVLFFIFSSNRTLRKWMSCCKKWKARVCQKMLHLSRASYRCIAERGIWKRPWRLNKVCEYGLEKSILFHLWRYIQTIFFLVFLSHTRVKNRVLIHNLIQIMYCMGIWKRNCTQSKVCKYGQDKEKTVSFVKICRNLICLGPIVQFSKDIPPISFRRTPSSSLPQLS